MIPYGKVNKKMKKNKLTNLIRRCSIMIILLSVLITAISCQKVVTDTTVTEDFGNTNNNLIHRGSICEKEGFVYYIIDNNKIYRSNISGEEVKLVYDAKEFMVWNINVNDNYIFFSQTSKQGPNIYRINKDGTNLKLISEIVYSGPFFYNGYLYYLSLYNSDITKIIINRTDIDGNKKTQLGEFQTSVGMFFNISNNYLYFRSIDGIERIRIDGTDRSLVIPDSDKHMSWEFIIFDDYAYYIYGKDYNLYRSKINSEGKQKIFDNPSSFYVAGNWIYACIDRDGMYKVNLDGSGKQKINSNYSYDYGAIFAGKDSIYYSTDNKTINKLSYDGTNQIQYKIPN